MASRGNVGRSPFQDAPVDGGADLDKTTASRASEIAAAHRLRGADAVYAAVAWRFGTELVTRDRQQRVRKGANGLGVLQAADVAGNRCPVDSGVRVP